MLKTFINVLYIQPKTFGQLKMAETDHTTHYTLIRRIGDQRSKRGPPKIDFYNVYCS